MAIEKVIDIKIQGNVDQAVGSLRSQLREAQADVAALSDKFGVTSVEAAAAARKAAELKDRIGDAKALTDAFNPDAKFQALTSSLSGVAGGFAAVQGGMALFGAQSEEVEATLLKVQSAMALSQGLQAVGQSLDSFRQLGAVIKDLNIVKLAFNFIETGQIGLVRANTIAKTQDAAATAALSTATVASTAATSTATIGLKLFRLALIGTGIGALVVGLVALYQNFDKVKAAVLNVLPGLTDISNFIGNVVTSITDFVGATSDASRELDNIRKAAARTLESNRKYLEQHGDQLDEFSQKKIAAKDKYLKALEDEKNGEQDRVELAKRLNRELIAIDKEREDKNKEVREKKRKEAEAAAKKLELTDSEKKEKQKQLDKKYFKEIDQSQTDFDVSSLENLDAKNQAIRDKQTEFNEEQIAAQLQQELFIAQVQYDSEEAQDERRKAARDKKIQNFQETTDAVASIAQSGENLLSAIQANGLARGKAGQAVMKGLALVQIAADSAIAFSKMMQGTETVAAGASLSVPPPAAPATYLATKVAFYASGSATILANLARARALLSGGGGGGGGTTVTPTSAGGGAGATAPQFNVVGSTGVNQLAGVLGNNQPAPVQAYVVANNVTTAQSLDRNIISSATLGG